MNTNFLQTGNNQQYFFCPTSAPALRSVYYLRRYFYYENGEKYRVHIVISMILTHWFFVLEFVFYAVAIWLSIFLIRRASVLTTKRNFVRISNCCTRRSPVQTDHSYIHSLYQTSPQLLSMQVRFERHHLWRYPHLTTRNDHQLKFLWYVRHLTAIQISFEHPHVPQWPFKTMWLMQNCAVPSRKGCSLQPLSSNYNLSTSMSTNKFFRLLVVLWARNLTEPSDILASWSPLQLAVWWPRRKYIFRADICLT